MVVLALIALIADLFDPVLPVMIGTKTGLFPFVSEAMVYVVPRTRACRPDQPSKTIFPEDVTGNITWTCLANLAAFAVLNDYLLGSRR